MDERELTLVRDLRTDAPPLPPEVRYAARTRLRREIAASTAPPDRGPLLGVVVAASLAGAVALGVTLLAQPPLPLDRTQVAALGGVGAAQIPRPDQYLYSKEILIERRPGERRRFVDETWWSMGQGPSRASERGRSWVGSWPDVVPPRRWDVVSRLPAEPAALRQWFVERYGPDVSMYLQMLLRGHRVMPLEVRRAAFEALLREPGVRMVPDVDAIGRRGLRIVTDEPGRPEQIIVRPRTFEYLGFRDQLEGWERVSAMVRTAVVDELDQRPG